MDQSNTVRGQSKHKRPFRMKGRLTVVAGPMFSGKTGKIVAMVDVFTRMGHKVLIVKPGIDSRYGGGNHVHSHDNRKAEALVFDGENHGELYEDILATGVDKVIFDEVQFFNKEKIKEVIMKLKRKKIHVIAAGLLYDYKRQPFGATPDLLGLADESVELFSVCQKCGGIASHTERTRGGKKQVAIGAADMYIASCRKCHTIYS